MSENQVTSELSSEEKTELLRQVFSTLEVDEQAIFTQWCHEQVEKGGAKLLGKKMQEASLRLNNFVERAYSQATRGVESISNKSIGEPNSIYKDPSQGQEDGPSFFD